MDDVRGEYEQRGGYGPPVETCGLAIYSLVASIVGYVLCFGIIAWIPGIILGHMALGEIKRAGGSLGGRGLALGGLIASYVGIGITVLVIIGMLFVFMFAGARSVAMEDSASATAVAREERAVIEEKIERDEFNVVQPIAADDEEAGTISRERMVEIRSALDAFKRDIGAYPTEAHGLRALMVNPGGAAAESWMGPYLKEYQVDPWGNPYGYRNQGGSFQLFSLGKDGQESDDDIPG
ncbi:MAG: type II secretion system protein GspG [Planctomycetota bacterium]|jgi:general secretion pathway protein G